MHRNTLPDDAHGKYKLITELGRGGTANVYLAVARGVGGFNKLVVLKTLKRDLAGDPEFHALFLNEARLAARLNHPNVVQTYEVAVEGGVPIIVMEYLDGQPLSNILTRSNRTLPIAEHVRILIDVLAGLHYAHEVADFDGTPLGVVHRDVTVQNVFVTFDGQIKILDFGIAKLANSLVETETGVVKGKTRYMPPEQLSGEPIDRRADIFAVGVMLWEAAAGQTLWKGLPDATITNRVLNGDIPRPSSVNPDAPKALESICMKALAVDRNDRYSTAAELEADLEEVIGMLGPPVSARRIGKAVSILFSEVRVKTKHLIDAELGPLGLGLGEVGSPISTRRGRDSSPLDAYPLATEMTFAHPKTAPWPADGSGAAPVPPQTVMDFRPLGWAAISVAAFAVGVWMWNTASLRAERVARPAVDAARIAARAVPVDSAPAISAGAASPPGQPSADLPAPAVPAPARVRLSTEPANARLYVDHHLARNPYVQRVELDGTRHTLRAEAEGYQSRTVDLVFEGDAEMVIALQRLKPSQPHQPRAAAQPATALGRSASPSTGLSPGCESPYYIDQRGIKKFKPECL